MTLKVEPVQWKDNKKRIIGRIDSRQELELVRDHFQAIETTHTEHGRGGLQCNQMKPGCAYARDESYLVVLAKEGIAFEIGIGAMICYEVDITDDQLYKVHNLDEVKIPTW